MRARIALVSGILAVVLGAPAVAQANVITVDVHDDGTVASHCTLHDAIVAANTNATPATTNCAAGSNASTDTINFSLASPDTILLAAQLPALSGPVSIQGPGAGQLTVDGQGAVRVLAVNNFAGSASISGLTIAHGSCAFACGINNGGTLNLDHVTVDHNTATVSGGANAFPEAGGILNQGTLTLTETTVSQNTVSALGGTNQNAPEGGGIFNNNGATLTLDRSTVSGNTASADAMGGSTTNANGGGITNFGALTVTRSTFSGNTASATGGATADSAQGGAIANANSMAVTVAIDRSTIAQNTTTASGASPTAQAGGFNVSGGSFSVTSTTIAANSAPTGANVVGGTATFKNTIVAGAQGGGANCGGGAVTSQGYNLESANSCGFNQAGDQPSTNPMLDPGALANNGGPTQTIALQPGSPAIDQGMSSVGETVDQRGLPRPSDFGAIANAAGGDGSDIGAFELQDTVAPDTIIDSGPADGSLTANPSPSFGFSSTEPGSTFECSIDGAAFSACGSPDQIGPLPDGQHSFAARAVDVAHNTDPSPATRTFTVDTTAPDTTITSGPANASMTSNATPTFGFDSSEGGSTFECSVDAGPFGACSSPDMLSHLGDGGHTFSVRATDAAGNTDSTPDGRTFSVDTAAPQTTLVKPPNAKTRHRKLRLRFRSSEPGSTFECKLDRKPFSPCTSPYATPKLKFKSHAFKVRAIDQAGNADGTVAKTKFRVVRRR